LGSAAIDYAFNQGAGGLKAYFTDTPEGLYNNGVKYLHGDGAVRAPVKAKEYFLRSAERDYSQAQFALAQLEYNGDVGVPQDLNDAAKWYEAAAKHDDSRAAYMIGYMYSTGVGVGTDRVDPQKAATYLEQAAKGGDRQAQKRLGYDYETAFGVSKDYQQAGYWYRKATDQGDLRAGVYLASLLLNGQAGSAQGFAYNDQEAFGLLSKAAQAGIATAESGLAWAYENGRGIPKDLYQARSLYLHAATGGDSFGEFNLARFCDYGLGGPVDTQCAIQWYQKASKNNELDSSSRSDANTRLQMLMGTARQ
jgi:uncharacterized protein